MSRAATSTVMEMVRSREPLREIEMMTEWSGNDIFVLAAREGYAFDDRGTPSQVGVAHAAGALLKYQGKGVRKQRTPRGQEPIQEAQCDDDTAHVPHEWILGSKANGVVRSCLGWTQEQVDEAHAAIDGPDQQEAAEDEAGRYEGFEPKIPANAEEGAELGEAMTAAEYGVTLTDVATLELDDEIGGDPCGDLTEGDETLALAQRQPPEGWFPFGTHAGPEHAGIRLVFSDESDDVGDPLWEKPFEGFGGAERPRSYIPNDEVDATPGWHHDAAGAPVFDGQAAIDAGLLDDDDEQPVVRQDIGHGLCPRCGSNDPKLHPATAFEGEVIVCPHDFHQPATQGEASDTQGIVAAVREGASGIVGPFEFEIEQLVAWAARWEPEIGHKAQSVRILAEGCLAAVRDLHEAIAVWESTVKRQALRDEEERLLQALAEVRAQLAITPAPRAGDGADGNDRLQPTAELPAPHVAGPGERRGDPGVVPRPVLLGQAQPLVRKPYHRSVTQVILDDLRVRGISQQQVREWAVSKGLAKTRGGLSVDACLQYLSDHGIPRGRVETA